MRNNEIYWEQIRRDLESISSPVKAESSRRYFPLGTHCLGVTATDIKSVVSQFQSQHKELTAQETLALTEYILPKATFSEEVLVAFALINKFVKKNYDDNLLLRFKFWLENYATNWSHVDDLCIKTIFVFFVARPHLIESTQDWAHSKVSWCRRASNVVWVKFIKRKVGKTTYYLDKKMIFKNCDLLIGDQNEFVQKSVGWLLKVTSLQHNKDVVTFIENNAEKMPRATLRYAIEKMDQDTRKYLLSLGKNHYP
jgi:3-methyladenine DNA glycosylase AlkD